MNSSARLRRFCCIAGHLQAARARCLHAASSIENNSSNSSSSSRSSSSSSRCTSSGVRWLQPAGSGARRMEEAHQKGNLHFTTCLTLSTAEPLRAEDLRKALAHLYNKMPPLRTCFRSRNDGELWVCELMEEEGSKIDFKEVRGSDFLQELTALMKLPYTNSDEGPLWRVWYMPGVPMTTKTSSRGTTESSSSEFPHVSTIMFSVHHGMTDGNALFHIMDMLINILEKVIEGIPVDDQEQLGEIVSDEQTLAVKEEIRDHFEKHPDETEIFVKNHLQVDFVPLLYQAFGFPKDPNPTTRHLISRLETPTLQRFHEKCNEAGVTFNSGIVMAINTALVELVLEAGVRREAFQVTSRHAINLRRYWQKHKFFSFGCHIGRMPQVTETPPYDKRVFWEYARRLDNQMREKLKSKHMLKEEVVKELKGIKAPKMEFKKPLPVDCDYYISNAYLPGQTLWSDHKHVKVSRILTFIHIHLCEYMTFHTVASVPGHMSYTLNYSTWHITDENALKFLRKVESIIEDLTL